MDVSDRLSLVLKTGNGKQAVPEECPYARASCSRFGYCIFCGLNIPVSIQCTLIDRNNAIVQKQIHKHTHTHTHTHTHVGMVVAKIVPFLQTFLSVVLFLKRQNSNSIYSKNWARHHPNNSDCGLQRRRSNGRRIQVSDMGRWWK